MSSKYNVKKEKTQGNLEFDKKILSRFSARVFFLEHKNYF